jgi:hypothetical protein
VTSRRNPLALLSIRHIGRTLVPSREPGRDRGALACRRGGLEQYEARTRAAGVLFADYRATADPRDYASNSTGFTESIHPLMSGHRTLAPVLGNAIASRIRALGRRSIRQAHDERRGAF